MSILAVSSSKGKYTVVCSVFLAIIMMSGCKTSVDMNDKQARAEVENQIGIKFCDSIEWLYCVKRDGMDDDYYAVFRIPKKDIDVLFQGIKIDWYEDRRYVGDNSSMPSKYKPSLIKKFKSFQTKYPNDYTVLNGLYDNSSTDKNEKVLFYLLWFEL